MTHSEKKLLATQVTNAYVAKRIRYKQLSAKTHESRTTVESIEVIITGQNNLDCLRKTLSCILSSRVLTTTIIEDYYRQKEKEVVNG